MKKLFVLGAGEIGRRLIKHLEDNWEVTFVDSNAQIQTICQKAVIKVEEYLEKYSEEFILIAHLNEGESIAFLQKNHVENYFIHCELPGEFKEPCIRNLLKDYVVRHLGKRKDYVLYGLGLYSIIIDDWLYQQLGIHPYILVQDNISKDFVDRIKKKYEGLKLINDIKELKNIKELCICLDNYFELTGRRIFKKYCKTDLFDCTDRIEKYHNPKIEKFHNIHRGERCFIVATGPSLKMEDLDVLKDNKEKSISMNSILYAFGKTKWLPDYFVMSDYRGFEEFGEILDALPIKAKFLSDNSDTFWKSMHDKSIYCYHQHYEYYFGRLPKFSDDFSKKSYTAGTVTYTCIQLAVYMGFREIYLLGVDFTGAGRPVSKYQHFHAEKELVAVNYTDLVKAGYEKAKQYADSHGIKIYNATRGGELEIFERADFDSLF